MVQAVHDALELITAPTLLAISVDDVRDHLRIVTTEDDRGIERRILSAIEQIESVNSRQFITATYTLHLDWFPTVIELRRPPIASITSVIYTDTEGTSTKLASSKYTLDAKSTPGRLKPAYGEVWPSTRSIDNAVAVKFVCGYGSAPVDVPDKAKQLIRLLVEQDYYGSYDNMHLTAAIDSLMSSLNWGALA